MPGNWRAGASQPSRATGTIFLYTYVCFYPARPHMYRKAQRVSKSANSCTSNTVMFYIFPNKRIRAHCRVTCTGLPIMQAVTWFMQARSCRRSTRSCRLPARSCIVPSTLHQPIILLPYISWIGPARQQCSTSASRIQLSSKHTCNPSICTSSSQESCVCTTY